MNKKVKSTMIKAEISKDDMINLYLDLILIWNNNNHKDRRQTINEHIEVLRGLTKK